MKPSKYAELCERMRKLTAPGDEEAQHSMADDILCEALKELGCAELVELFDKVEKWYA